MNRHIRQVGRWSVALNYYKSKTPLHFLFAVCQILFVFITYPTYAFTSVAHDFPHCFILRLSLFASFACKYLWVMQSPFAILRISINTYTLSDSLRTVLAFKLSQYVSNSKIAKDGQ